MRTFTMAKKVGKQIIGDKRSLALLFVAPIFMLFLLSIIMNSTITKPNLEVIKSETIPFELMESLNNETNITESKGYESVLLDKLKNKEFDGLITFKDNKLIITVEGTDTSITSAVRKSVSTAFADYSKKSVSSNPKLIQMGIQPISNEFVFINGGENSTTFDAIAPMMMGFFIFFFVFLLAGVAFLRERISGTLERLMATPIKRIEIVLGYFFGFGLFVMLQTIVIQCFMIYGLKITVKGNFFLVLLINLLLAAGSLSLGTLLSSFAKNELQLFQFIPVVIVPQILFCGLFSLREAPIWVTALSKVFPLTYGADALSAVVLRGSNFSDVWLDILIIFGYAVLFIILNSLALKKYRKL